MNLIKKISASALLVVLLGFYSCNSNDSNVDIESLGNNGQISSFAVAAIPYNAADSITFPVLKSTFFTILSSSADNYQIFNLDSLPPRINLTKKMMVTLSYIGSPSGIELIYLNQNREDSVATWNTSDSVSFIFDDANKQFYPKFNVISANAQTKRRYTVDFRVHNVQPDSIIWDRPKVSGSNFVLPQSGESNVICDKDTTTFYALIQNDLKTTFAVSPINNPAWVSYDLGLPTNLQVKSLVLRDKTFSVLTKQGEVYQFFANDLSQSSKQVTTSVTYRTIIGVLPNVSNSTDDEILVTYYNANSELLFGKTKDFTTVEPIEISGSTINQVETEFPISSYAQTYREIGNTTSIVLTGGKTIGNSQITRSWFVNNMSLATSSKPAVVSILPGKMNTSLPFDSGISTFVYNDSIQAFSGDSLRLYTSIAGQEWVDVSDYNVLSKDMGNINRPSIIVDKNKYIWVFGGETPLNLESSTAYYRDIWRGRMNKMTFKPIEQQ